MRNLPLYAFALCVPALVASIWAPSPSDASTTSPCAATMHDDDTTAQMAASHEALKGLWSRYDGRTDGTPLRFYYFHDDGIGLYRYGRVGLNNTHSYHYAADGTALTLTFNKTGTVVKTPYQIVEEDWRQVLLVQQDPYEPGVGRYVKEMGPMADHVDVDTAKDRAKGPGFDRMWMHVDAFRNGGIEFSIYQFKEPALDGRGVGWHHRGDFDNWSTETLFYRKDGDRLALYFPQRDEQASSTMTLTATDGRRTLSLGSDPRNYWQSSTFVDGGRAFGVSHEATQHDAQAAWIHLMSHTAGMR